MNPAIIYSCIGWARSADVFIWDIRDGGDLRKSKELEWNWGGNGLYKSSDHGKSWQMISSMTMGILAIVHSDSNIMFTSIGKKILKSTDGGITWKVINSAAMKSELNQLVIDPHNPDILYAVTAYQSGGHVAYYIYNRSRIYRSGDGGESWKQISTFPANRVAIDPLNSQVIYAATPGYGIFKSTDAGETWQQCNSGLGLAGRVL